MVLSILGVSISGSAGQRSPVGRERIESPLLVTQLPAKPAPAGIALTGGGMLRAQYGTGARLCVVSPDKKIRILAEGFHSACEGSVSFDAKRILFSGKKKASDPWNIYETAVDGGKIRQITRNTGNCRRAGYQPKLYTIVSPQPWYQITFVSDAAGNINEYSSARATDLYSCKLDGASVRRITFNPSSDMDPFVMSNGRLLFASWRRSGLGRGVLGHVSLFGMGIDGTDYAAFSGDQGRRIKHMPCTTTGGLAVFVEADRVGWDGAGFLSRVKLRRPLHSYGRITKVSDGLFHSPAPLPDGKILVSRRPADGSGTHGVFRLDPVTGRSELIFDDPKRHDIHATMIHKRSEPDGRSTVVTSKDPSGKLYCLNVYTSDLKDPKWTPPGTIKSVRVLAAVPRSVPAVDGIPPLIGRRILGQVPIEADGSFNIEVPANTPIELQTLDADGMALRTCSWIWARNHEPRGCIGCHEDGELTPENHFQKAFERKSVSLRPPKRRSVDFRRHVMPIIKAKCVPCHGPRGAPPRLDGGDKPVRKSSFNRAYESLLALEKSSVKGDFRGRYVHPGHARKSPLVWHVYGRNTARGWDGAMMKKRIKPIARGKTKPLSDAEKRTFVEWIDLGAMWNGESR
ncbi:MAG: hypothetical protein QGH60_22990 [Phycisphaerae bacterium]|jgi:hypothetical protein|nr:hypothetical protein [Phycisphaerae bacterium]